MRTTAEQQDQRGSSIRTEHVLVYVHTVGLCWACSCELQFLFPKYVSLLLIDPGFESTVTSRRWCHAFQATPEGEIAGLCWRHHLLHQSVTAVYTTLLRVCLLWATNSSELRAAETLPKAFV